jgi:antitoxin ParD1/3/4
MDQMTLELSEAVREAIEGEVAAGNYSNPGDYISKLVRDDQQKKAKAVLKKMVLDSLASGEATEMTAEDWQDLRRQLHSGADFGLPAAKGTRRDRAARRARARQRTGHSLDCRGQGKHSAAREIRQP